MMARSRAITAVHRLIIAMIGLMAAVGVHSQELNCVVEVDATQVEGSRHVFETLQTAINDYMNTTQFTNTQFSPNEKIDCRMFLTIKEYTDDRMSGDLQIQSTRPVFNSSYTTTLINFTDSKIEFEYRENAPLIFSVNQMESQLTAILNFYAYLILAVDFDSFSPRGGEVCYDRLKQIVQMAQSAGESGWRPFEDTKNRAAVLSSFTDPATECIRELLYEYHRKGLDEMALGPDKGRSRITAALQNIGRVYEASPMSVALSMFKDAKLDELVNIYSKAPQAEREGVYDLLYPVYPTETQRLEKIKTPEDKR